MNKIFRLVMLTLSFTFCFTALVYGQRTTGDLEGKVTDSTGAVVPGVSITVTGLNVGFNRTVLSNDDGVYYLGQIPAGNYRVKTAPIKGFGETSVDTSVAIEKTVTVNIVLSATSVNTVDVTLDPLGVNVDTSDSKVQTNITSALITQLPKGTSLQSVIKTAPGARGESKSGGLQIDGASGSENSFVIDGVPLENFRTGTLNANNDIPTTLIQEIQVKTSGFEAEHGGASGGVISVQTKSGSNEFRGNFESQFTTAKLQPSPRFAPSSFIDPNVNLNQYVYGVRGIRDQFVNFYPSASLGGPIVKNRVWFYGNYSPQFFNTTRTSNFFNSITTNSFTGSQANVAPAGTTSNLRATSNGVAPLEYKTQTRYEYAFGKIDAAIFNNLRYTGTFLWNPVITDGNLPFGTMNFGTTPNNSNPYAGQILTSQQLAAIGGGRQSSNNTTHQLSYDVTNNLNVSARYGRSFLNEKNGNYAVPNATSYSCVGFASAYDGTQGCVLNFNSLGNVSNSVTVKDVSLTNTLNLDATYLVNSFFGRHVFKGGYQYGTTKNDVDRGYASTGTVAFRYGRNFSSYGVSGIDGLCNLATDCAGVGRMIRFGTKGLASNKYQAIYIQDKYQPTSRITLNLGVRAENENLPAFNTTGQGGQPINFSWSNKITPRLGISVDPFGDGKTRIWGTYGQFTDRLRFALPRGSFGGDFYRIDYFRIPKSNQLYSFYTPARLLGNFKDPIGGGNPSTAGGLSIYQQDQRIPSNISEADAKALGLPFSGIDNDLKPFKQSEITAGVERELSSLFVLSVRYTRKNVDNAIEDIGILGLNASENYIIGNPGQGKGLALQQAAGYSKSLKPQRLYNGLEFSLSKRFANNYFFNVNYTLSKLKGNYSGLASSDENGRTDPGVSRYFDYIVNGFTFNGDPDNGDLPTDRRHVIKAYGAYTVDWWGSKTNATDISFFQQILQGTPQTTYMGIEQSSIVFTKRGDLGRTPYLWQTDMAVTHTYKFGSESKYKVAFEVNAINVFNNNTVTSFNTTKYAVQNGIAFSDIDGSSNLAVPLNKILNGQFKASQVDAILANYHGSPNPLNVLYGKANGYQGARSIRFAFRFFF